MKKQNLIKGILFGLVGFLLMYINSAIAEEPCEIYLDYYYENVEYGESRYVYLDERSVLCEGQYVSCDNEGDYLGEWYSSCISNPTVRLLEGETVNYTLNGDENFEAGVLEISGYDTKIYILDSNLGDSAYFQWGNNYGFYPNSILSTSNVQIQSSSLNYNPLNQQYYYSPIFIYGHSNWLDDDSIVDLWGGSYDDHDYNEQWQVTNAEERRGPCPENFHVPSRGELEKLLYDMYYYDTSDMMSDLSIPGAGLIYSFDDEFYVDDYTPCLSSSSPYSELSIGSWSGEPQLGGVPSDACPVRCFYNSYETYAQPVKLLVKINESMTTTIGGNTVTGLPTTMTVTQNTISTAEGKEVLGEVNVDFGSNQTATFSHPVQVKIPVSDHEQVYVKVKHGGDSTYGYDGLTTNSSASCSNGEVVATSDRYNGETINVADGYATIYSCAASSFIALGVENGGEPQVIVNIGQFNGGQNTCTGSNFIFENITAGTNTGTYIRTGVFECSFGNGRSSSIIQLQLSGNLVASGDRVLSGTNVKMINSEWTSQPLGLKFASTLLETYEALTTTQVLFRKSADLIGIASGVVTIKLTVPGGTPDGTYNGTLVLTY